jgi:hypothetical protein
MIRKTSQILSLVLLSLAVATSWVYAERGDDADRVSKNGSTMGDIDGITVTVEYGRPNVKGREIWGELVPYDEVWRTGANEATTIEFSGDVAIDGQKLPAGRYSLFTIPGAEEWTVIFNDQPDQWGAFKYDSSHDVLRVTATPGSSENVESLDFVIDGSSVVLRWEEIAVPIEVAAN